MTSEYQQACDAIRGENKKLIAEFAEWLANKGRSEPTIEDHRENVEFYLDHFLLNYEATKAEEGVYSVGSFLGDWFIRKAMWASRAQIKANAASLKKFYTFMLAKGRITARALADLTQCIKEDMPSWLATMARYDDPSIEDLDDVWDE